MSERKDQEQTPAEEPGTPTQHGQWTPEVSQAADREMRELAQEPPGTQPATEGVDKSHLSLPKEQRPIDH
ncbi:hypothetical protein E5F05_03410 (plasmid) [Deinococcus metallilatus]|uniref:Uncharacterized protein n=1 Tax=Deinococcus metallilatus TaxID=1211322 RepID=A0AAJ5F6Z4_9DEIO|nr:hypothetical protein [Deinococcus metallilatus]MBB5297275.1 hypothetical protein [Deinococcus metallilatus]QBY06978.1 hypothetical protein E5F05_03410 [Deinococcus metallilatus]TLK31925.1 hypothetical protein FCS05_00175 [Deinococcus metallilatus]GMA17161.1 hypothetical protein GCM10025871_34920 [Deinococcus metallilatus]